MLTDKVLVALKSKAPRLKYDTSATPHLYVNLTFLAEGPNRFAAFIQLELDRPVEILVGQDHIGQTPSKRVWTSEASVWDDGAILAGPAGTAADQIGNERDRLLENFFADWYRAKP